MKMQIKINLTFDDSFEKKIFADGEILGVRFRNSFLVCLGHLMRVEESDDCQVNSFTICKILDESPEDPDIKNDITGDAT